MEIGVSSVMALPGSSAAAPRPAATQGHDDQADLRCDDLPSTPAGSPAGRIVPAVSPASR